jgi:hypothetical protein
MKQSSARGASKTKRAGGIPAPGQNMNKPPLLPMAAKGPYPYPKGVKHR